MIEMDDLYKGCIEDRNMADLKRKAKNAVKFKKCPQCNYKSSQACNLRRHLKIHSGEK